MASLVEHTCPICGATMAHVYTNAVNPARRLLLWECPSVRPTHHQAWEAYRRPDPTIFGAAIAEWVLE